MKLRQFLLCHWVHILLSIFFGLYLTVFLYSLGVNVFGISFLLLGMLILLLSLFFYDFFTKKKFYDDMNQTLNGLTKKYLLTEMMEEPSFLDGKILYEVLVTCMKAMNDEIAKYKKNEREMNDYLTSWIHEVKIPMSVISLVCENEKNKSMKLIMDEVGKIDNYVEQALFFQKSSCFQNDFLITECSLNSIIKETIKRNSINLINLNCHIDLFQEEVKVFVDKKWFMFVLNQVISNSIKYCKPDFSLSFSVQEKEKGALLTIKDNGVGIPSDSLPRVFEKGFTGTNVRDKTKSTGIGLYLIRNLCEKMKVGISIDSKENEWTEVTFAFSFNRDFQNVTKM